MTAHLEEENNNNLGGYYKIKSAFKIIRIVKCVMRFLQWSVSLLSSSCHPKFLLT